MDGKYSVYGQTYLQIHLIRGIGSLDNFCVELPIGRYM